MGFIQAVAGPSRGYLISMTPHIRSAPGGRAAMAAHGPKSFRSISTIRSPTPARPSPPLPAHRHSGPSSRRGISTSIDSSTTVASTAIEAVSELSVIETLSSILISSPLSAGTTIIILTLLVRGGITLPATIWQRRRARRTREVVQPEMKKYNDELAVRLAGEMRREGRGYEEYKAELKKRLAAHQLSLLKRHNTHPLITLLTPLAIHVPILITLSLTIRGALAPSPELLSYLSSTPAEEAMTEASAAAAAEGIPLAAVSDWADQAFWWLPALGLPDGSVMLPLIGGVAAMVNAEMAGKKGEVRDAAASAGEASGERETESTETIASSSGSGAISHRSSSQAKAKTSPTRPSPAHSSRSSRPSTPLPAHLSRPAQPSRAPSARSISLSAPSLKAGKKPTVRYSSPTLVQAAQRQAAARPSSEHLSSITPQEELEKERSKAGLRQKFMSNILRCGAVVFVPFAATVPAALALYWTTSMVFTMTQNAVLDWYEKKHTQALTLKAAPIEAVQGSTIEGKGKVVR